MACQSDWAPGTWEAYSDGKRSAKEEIDALTRLLCALCRRVELGSVTIDQVPGLRDWWTRHQEFDRKQGRGLATPEEQ